MQCLALFGIIHTPLKHLKNDLENLKQPLYIDERFHFFYFFNVLKLNIRCDATNITCLAKKKNHFAKSKSFLIFERADVSLSLDLKKERLKTFNYSKVMERS
jgi:hypothetical protein